MFLFWWGDWFVSKLIDFFLLSFHSAHNLWISFEHFWLHVTSACLFLVFPLGTQLANFFCIYCLHVTFAFLFVDFSLSTQLVNFVSIYFLHVTCAFLFVDFSLCPQLVNFFCMFFWLHVNLCIFFLLHFLRIQPIHFVLFIYHFVHNQCICIAS